uniref:Major facilitator superfamily (MFS) profile domain-containing protein n=1 Tax=Ditylenchus dipsaci TaxID=166011 RepID=A0A915DMV7_9BILA
MPALSQPVSIFAPSGQPTRTVVYTAIIIVLSRFYLAYAMSYTNTAAERFKTYLKNSYISRGIYMSDSSVVWLWSMILNCFFIGIIVGNVVTPFFTDRLGRKTSAVIGICGMLLASVLETASIYFELPELYVMSRIFGAIMFCINATGWSLIIAEAVPCKLRGTCFFVAGVSFSATVLLGMVFGTDYLLGENLLMLIAFGLLPIIPCCFITLQIKESPKFLLLTRKDREGAKESLLFYQGNETSFEKFEEDTLKEEGSASHTSSIKIIKDLFYERHLRRAIILGVVALQLGPGVWSITTELLLAHFSLQKAQVFSSALFGSNFAAGCCGIFTIKYVSRRKLLFVTNGIHIMSLAAYITFDRLAVLCNLCLATVVC